MNDVDGAPAPDAVHGYAGLAYLEWAAAALGEGAFRDLYEHRAPGLVRAYAETASATLLERLRALGG